jgi:predicted transcriptional regulator
MRFAKWLDKTERTLAGFARESGIPRSTLLGIQAGTAEPQASTCVKIIKATRGRVGLKDLVLNKNKPNRGKRAAVGQ